MAVQTVYPPVAVGDRYCRLKVIELLPAKNRRSILRLRCDCGKEIDRPRILIQRGNTKSCGCLSIETTRARVTKHGALVGKTLAEAGPEYCA